MANKLVTKPTPKMNLYVNGKLKIQVDVNVAHDVAETYMREGDNVWLTRAAVNMDGNRPNPQHRKARGKRDKPGNSVPWYESVSNEFRVYSSR